MKNWKDIQSETPGQIVDWAQAQPWARLMAACMQDASWHAEGDVWTHTRMVLDQVVLLPEYAALDRDSQLKLLFTALFHDSGKPATTIIDPDTGRTRSPKHAQVGVKIGRSVLRDLRCPLELREQIAGLVRYHGRPPYLLEKADPAHELIYLSWLTHHRLLYLFALADTRGRTTRDTGRAEENLDLWKMVAQENNCFDGPYAFANASARVGFYRNTLSSLYYTPREDFRCTVTLMSGLPGAGKDTWLARERPQLPVVSLDEIRHDLDVEPTGDQGHVIHAARELCREHLRANRDFAFNATNTMHLTRKLWIDLFIDYNARVEIVYIEPPLDVIFEQNKRRSKTVPAAVMHRLVEKLEPPTWAEAHDLTMIG